MIPKVDVQVERDVHEQAGHPGQPVRDAGRRRRTGRQLHGVQRASSRRQLGRNLSGDAPNVDGQLDRAAHAARRSRQRDGHCESAKIVRFGKSRVNVGFDVYNLLNSSAMLSYNQAFIPNGAGSMPTSVMTARFAKVSAQFDF